MKKDKANPTQNYPSNISQVRKQTITTALSMPSFKQGKDHSLPFLNSSVVIVFLLKSFNEYYFENKAPKLKSKYLVLEIPQINSKPVARVPAPHNFERSTGNGK